MVGYLPENKAHLVRIDNTKPFSAENFFWMCPGLPQASSASAKRLRELRKRVMEERIAHDKVLMKIRAASIWSVRNRYMIEARKAGYSFALIGMAARVTIQRVQGIVARGR